MDDIKLAGKKHNIDPMWKVLNKEVDLGEPTSFLDHVYLGCTQRQCEVSKGTVDNYRTMFESRISAGGTEKLPFSQNTRISSWSYDMVGHAKKCVERYGELANKTTQQLYRVSTPCIVDHHIKGRNEICWRIVTSMLTNCSEMFSWHASEDLIFYGQWISSRDRLQNGPRPATDAWTDWFHTFITHVNANSIVMWIILQNSADWDCFMTLTSHQMLKIQNPLLEEHCAFLEVIHLFR